MTGSSLHHVKMMMLGHGWRFPVGRTGRRTTIYDPVQYKVKLIVGLKRFVSPRQDLIN